MILPREIEELIQIMTGTDEPSKFRRLRNDLRRLTEDFARLSPIEDDHLDAYLAFHFPTNLMKVVAVVHEILALTPDAFPERSRYDVLDIGCGEGAGMFGFFFARNKKPESEFRLRGIEASASMLERCRSVADHLASRYANLRLSLTRQRLTPSLDQALEGTYDAILCVNSLAEIIPDGPLPPGVLAALTRRLKPDGVIIIIEPALKIFTRRLMVLRDEMMKNESIRIILPCLHNEACPLLRITTRDEWCHETRSWNPPAYMVRLNQGLNREIDRLKYSYLAAVRKGSAEPTGSGYRVISRRIKEKGKMKCYLCAPDGRIEMARQDKNRSETNAAFDDIQQGDVVCVENADLQGRYMRITKETTVSVVSN
jgi:ribosomal protein RSM22 (predicted rRNA methylase)